MEHALLETESLLFKRSSNVHCGGKGFRDQKPFLPPLEMGSGSHHARQTTRAASGIFFGSYVKSVHSDRSSLNGESYKNKDGDKQELKK